MIPVYFKLGNVSHPVLHFLWVKSISLTSMMYGLLLCFYFCADRGIGWGWPEVRMHWLAFDAYFWVVSFCMMFWLLYIPFVLLSCFFNTNYHSTTTTTIWKTLLSLVRILLFVSQIVRFVSDPKKKDSFLNNESRLQVKIIIQVWILWLVLV